MYFRNHRVRKRDLDECLKIPVSEDPSISNMVNVPKTVTIQTTAPLPYLLITANIIQLEKVFFSVMQNLETVC